MSDPLPPTSPGDTSKVNDSQPRRRCWRLPRLPWPVWLILIVVVTPALLGLALLASYRAWGHLRLAEVEANIVAAGGIVDYSTLRGTGVWPEELIAAWEELEAISEANGDFDYDAVAELDRNDEALVGLLVAGKNAEAIATALEARNQLLQATAAIIALPVHPWRHRYPIDTAQARVETIAMPSLLACRNVALTLAAHALRADDPTPHLAALAAFNDRTWTRHGALIDLMIHIAVANIDGRTRLALAWRDAEPGPIPAAWPAASDWWPSNAEAITHERAILGHAYRLVVEGAGLWSITTKSVSLGQWYLPWTWPADLAERSEHLWLIEHAVQTGTTGPPSVTAYGSRILGRQRFLITGMSVPNLMESAQTAAETEAYRRGQAILVSALPPLRAGTPLAELLADPGLQAALRPSPRHFGLILRQEDDHLIIEADPTAGALNLALRLEPQSARKSPFGSVRWLRQWVSITPPSQLTLPEPTLRGRALDRP